MQMHWFSSMVSSHDCNTQGSDCTPELVDEATRYRIAATDAWNRLGFPGTLKLHCIEAHAIGDVNFWKGLKHRTEDFVEQMHQHGRRDMLRTRGLRYFNRRIASVVRFQAMEARHDVAKQQETVRQRQKRRFRHDRPPAGSNAHDKRETGRYTALDNYTLGLNKLGNPKEIPTSLMEEEI